MRFLSQEWVEAADAAIRAAVASAPDVSLTIDQHIDGVVAYRVVVDRTAPSVTLIDDGAASPKDRADAVFRQDATTALAIARGETDAHQSFLLGDLEFEGDIDVLIARRQAFAWLADVLAPVMSETEL